MATRNTCEGSVQGEAVQVPELDGLVSGCCCQLPNVWAEQALEHLFACTLATRTHGSCVHVDIHRGECTESEDLQAA